MANSNEVDPSGPLRGSESPSLPCPSCGSAVPFSTPNWDFTSFPSSAIMVASHPFPYWCRRCRAPLALALGGGQVAANWQFVPAPPASLAAAGIDPEKGGGKSEGGNLIEIPKVRLPRKLS